MTRLRIRSLRRPGLVAALAAGVLLLSSCGQATGPGVAAEVAGHPISDSDVDDFAEVLCNLGGLPGASEEGVSSAVARARALDLLIANELALGLLEESEADRASVEAAIAQNAPAREQVPASLRDEFDAFVEDFSTAQYLVLEAGRRSLAEAGNAEAGDEEAYAEGQRLRTEYAAAAGVEVDPRFGAYTDGTVVQGSGSLSVPASDEAVAAAEPIASPDLVGSLPASQTCA